MKAREAEVLLYTYSIIYVIMYVSMTIFLDRSIFFQIRPQPVTGALRPTGRIELG